MEPVVLAGIFFAIAVLWMALSPRGGGALTGPWTVLGRSGGAEAIVRVDSQDMLDEVLAQPDAILYKHSSRCWLSLIARRQVERFASERAGPPVYQLDVVENRALSNRLATVLGVPHQSPQAIRLRDGRAVWSASHAAVTTAALAGSASDDQPEMDA